MARQMRGLRLGYLPSEGIFQLIEPILDVAQSYGTDLLNAISHKQMENSYLYGTKNGLVLLI